MFVKTVKPKKLFMTSVRRRGINKVSNIWIDNQMKN